MFKSDYPVCSSAPTKLAENDDPNKYDYSTSKCTTSTYGSYPSTETSSRTENNKCDIISTNQDSDAEKSSRVSFESDGENSPTKIVEENFNSATKKYHSKKLSFADEHGYSLCQVIQKQPSFRTVVSVVPEGDEEEEDSHFDNQQQQWSVIEMISFGD